MLCWEIKTTWLCCETLSGILKSGRLHCQVHVFKTLPKSLDIHNSNNAIQMHSFRQEFQQNTEENDSPKHFVSCRDRSSVWRLYIAYGSVETLDYANRDSRFIFRIKQILSNEIISNSPYRNLSLLDRRIRFNAAVN